jgi:CHAT domain-containing protein
MTFIRCLIFVVLMLPHAFALAFEAGAEEWETALLAGIASRAQGNLALSVDQLDEARLLATSDGQKMRVAAELGASLLQARRLDQAKAPLLAAYSFFSGVERARVALDLGNLALLRREHKDAQRYYQTALQLSGDDTALAVIAELDLLRLTSAPEKSKKLAPLFQKIALIDDAEVRARLYLNLGSQAQALGKLHLALAFNCLDRARQLLSGAKISHLRALHVETFDALAQLYETQGRAEDALTLTQQALEEATPLAIGLIGDLAIHLEWRQARLQIALGQEDNALAAFQRAVTHIERLRLDIPIEYEDGRSSFRQTLEPIYLGLTERLLKEAERQSGSAQALYLRRAKDSIELSKQSELQDYLGDRCTVEAVKHGGGSSKADSIPAGTAVLYPIIFQDRLELLLETSAGIVRRTSPVTGSVLRETALVFAADLRDGEAGYLPRAKQLYDWLLRPFEALFSDQKTHTLVLVPDGALRLVALGALHDGKHFVLEKWAIGNVTGLSITNTRPPEQLVFQSLLVGASEFGPVVDKLESGEAGRVLAPEATSQRASRGLASHRLLRTVRTSKVPEQALSSANLANSASTENRTRALRSALALPGVKDEIAAIEPVLPGTRMLDAAFTVDSFRREAATEAHQIIHIASHGVFGGEAESSYILAYDDILTLDGLQMLLKSDQFRKTPIELLTLSACETAEGNDRSPLGISGAAIKARAKSVLGTLWPVDDNAARQVMEKFYRGLMTSHLSKAEALRQAQIELLRSDEFSHPFFWAPFLLVGNWL